MVFPCSSLDTPIVRNCAVSESDLDEALCTWTGAHPHIVSLEPNALADVWRDIEKIAAALDRPEAGRTLVARMSERMAGIAASTQALAPKPRVACIEWIDPLMAAGNWMPELVAMAGGTCLFGASGKHSPWMSWEELLAAQPDVVIVMPCGFDLPRTESEMHWLTRRPDWSAIADRVFVADGNQYFNRPGPRVVESLRILAEILHPDRFAPDLQGDGWRRFTA